MKKLAMAKLTKYEDWRKQFHKPGHLHIEKWNYNDLSKYIPKIRKRFKLDDDDVEATLDCQSFYARLNNISKKTRLKYNIPHHWIVIGDTANHVKVADLFHELGHYNCNINKCFCADEESMWGEYHAIKFGLDHLRRFKLHKSLRYEINHLQMYWGHNAYTKAARYLKRTKLWQEYLKLAKVA